MKPYYMLIALLILTRCSTNLNLETSSPTPTMTTPSTITSTVTRVATPMVLSTSTPTLSQSIPTPFHKEATEITLELLQANNGCNLPCWWGITPSQTRWSDAEEFLISFSSIYERQPPSEWFVYDVRSPISERYSEVEEIQVVYAVQGGVVKEIEISAFDEESYHLSSFLQKHGIPTEVVVSSYSSDYGLPPNQVPLSLNLYYPEKGINALYGTYAMIKDGQIIEGCLDTSPIIYLWTPEENPRSRDYILRWDETYTPYLDIEVATGLSVKDFFEKYSNSESHPCLQTPLSLWPSQ